MSDDRHSRWSIAPYFIVEDVVRAANDYRDRLAYDRVWGDPPGFCMVNRGGVVSMLSEIRGGAPRPNRTLDPEGEAWDAYVWVDDAVEDADGYRLCFGHSTW